MKENKGAFNENGDAITRGYIEPKNKIIDISKIEARIEELEKPTDNVQYKNVEDDFNDTIRRFALRNQLKEILQQAQDIPKQEESSNWDEIFKKYRNDKPNEGVYQWLKEHYLPPVKR